MENNTTRSWVKTGVVFGLLFTVIYPSMIFISFPKQIILILAFGFSASLAIASIGLYRFLSLNKTTVSLQIGVLFNIIACSVVFIMFALQISLFSDELSRNLNVPKETSAYVSQLLNITQLTLDIVWDMFISVGTFLLALNMMSHPRLGKIFGGLGILLSLMLFTLNVYTFPFPPGESELIDAGPFVSLWYLAVTIRIITSFKWLDSVTTKT
ncbi:MAG: hypothetical protein IT281_00325 [Ignavibacteria bacterium]|nr:hypothetical protein [Ignavibacteria bacterium]